MCCELNRIIRYVLIIAVLQVAGCSYFNTYYNIKRKFAEAEQDTRARERQASQTDQPSLPGEPAQTVSVPVDRYRAVIESGSKLLEFYPKSRWVDNTLLLMGISYFRMTEYSRAERKFTELLTIFPNSNLASEATVWRARSLLEQKKFEQAAEILQAALVRTKGRLQLGNIHFLLGRIYYRQKRWSDAADQFSEAVQRLRSPQKEEAAYLAGVSLYNQKDYEAAKGVFVIAARFSRKLAEAYQAHIYLSRCEAALKNFDSAENILTDLRSNRAFSSYAGELDLELANLAVEMGELDNGTALYEEYIQENEDGEGKGLACFRLALINRDILLNLPRAKSLADSSSLVGASDEISDSAKYLSQQLSTGLLAIQKIVLLQDSIRIIEQALDSLEKTSFDQSPDVIPAGPEPFIEEETQTTTVDSSASITDTVRTDVVDSLQEETGYVSPAAQAADSLLRVILARDSVVSVSEGSELEPDTVEARSAPSLPLASDSAAVGIPDSIEELTDQALAGLDTISSLESDSLMEDSISSGGEEPVTAADQIAFRSSEYTSTLQRLRRKLHKAYLHVGEFYRFGLQEKDSAQVYYKLAAGLNDDPDTRWKANLYLAYMAELRGDKTDAFYRAVVETDSVPVAVLNIARQALGYEVIDSTSEQSKVFMEAELGRLKGTISPDSAVALYRRVVDIEPMTDLSKRALFSMAHIYEYEIKQKDSAAVVFNTLIDLFPDSSFKQTLQLRLLPPDSSSIFLLSDSVLAATLKPPEIAVEVEQDESGWPPPEEDLRGRRSY